MIRLVIPALMIGSLVPPFSPVDAAGAGKGEGEQWLLLEKDLFEVISNQIQLPKSDLRVIAKTLSQQAQP